MRFKSIFSRYLIALLALILVVTGTACGDENKENPETTKNTTKITTVSKADKKDKEDKKETAEKTTKKVQVNNDNLSTQKVSASSLPKYNGKAYVVLNDNLPAFGTAQITSSAFESYSSLDSLGRCGTALACCGQEIMPRPGEKRGSISSIKPSGWNQAKYEFISGKYLYNRCHLIGWQLSAENANPRNLITGTKYINISGMLPFENLIADYIHETGNHVMYRVTPMYEGSNLVASGVQLEAYSVEDGGDSVCFNVYCFNVQPGVSINYANGSSWADNAPQQTQSPAPKPTQPQTTPQTQAPAPTPQSGTYILNTNSKKIHYPDCPSVSRMSDANKETYTGDINVLLGQGYTTCGNCFK